jgi:hypothetical protein
MPEVTDTELRDMMRETWVLMRHGFPYDAIQQMSPQMRRAYLTVIEECLAEWEAASER